MEIALKIVDRVSIANLLPVEGDFTEVRLADTLIKKTDIGADEARLLGMKQTPDGRLMWNPAADSPKTFDFSDDEVAFMREVLTKRNLGKKLTRDHLGLYLAFSKGASK